MTTPALQRLREHFAGFQITLVVHAKLADLWRHHPSVDEVITFPAGVGAWSVAASIRARQSASGRFDLALVLPNSPRSALEVWLARIPRRIGYSRPWRSWWLTQVVPSRPGHVTMRKRSVQEIKRLTDPASHPRPALAVPLPAAAHQTLDYLHLAAALGAESSPVAPHIAVTSEETTAAVAKFGLAGSAPVFGLMPGAEYGPAKRWPADRFVAAAREIQQRTTCTWLILGGKPEAKAAGDLARAIGTAASYVRPLAGQTSLRELCAVLKLCRVLLTNDSGPMHLAAAVGTPVIVPFGSTSAELTGPGLPGDPRHRLLRGRVPCAPCFRRTCPIDFRCMTNISVASVVEAVLDTVNSPSACHDPQSPPYSLPCS